MGICSSSGRAYAQAGAEYSVGLSISGALSNKLGQTLPPKQNRAVSNFNFEVDPADEAAALKLKKNTPVESQVLEKPAK